MGGKRVLRHDDFFLRELWHQETGDLILAWVEGLRVIASALLDHRRYPGERKQQEAKIEAALGELEPLRERTTPQAVRGAPGRPHYDGDWYWFRHELYRRAEAGMDAPFRRLGLFVEEVFGRRDLAERLMALHDLFEPEDAGIGAAHLRAKAGDREGVRALEQISDDPNREPSARVHALACLRDLEEASFVRASCRLYDQTFGMSPKDAAVVRRELESLMRVA